ncbi:DUF4278 domain-containing protein [Synechococcus sp. CS-1324]|uniref:DUF4278 domain-containing protein n=1 Tax=Synechococcus sp. CS-1324 TaxID=2847980 RepID=UPI000DB01AFF|nr:DUF4278 domain-containing protein [Synechococcus sp. CS-1324]MCT0230575.1 DUF4278 domain-containing protein [Synechococcus sp. CS-1324]PZV05699.1 MAG: hypothetical protein DCF23_02340 [Cyanobium sp.]
MTPASLVYRGVRHDGDQPAPTSDHDPVQHIYRGITFQEPLQHEPAVVNESIVLQYRGNPYHQRQQAAARQVRDR